MKTTLLRALTLSAAAVLAACGGGTEDSRQAMPAGSSAPPSAARAGATAIPGLQALDAPITSAAFARIDRRLRGATGEVEVWVQFDQASLASTRAALAKSTGIERVRASKTDIARGRAADAPAVRGAMAAQRKSLAAQQNAAAGRLASMGARELARVSVAHNAIAVRVNATQIASIAAMEGVVRVRPVVNYQLDLTETVPYIGGTAVQQGTPGFDGTGVRVAVIDSGIDYTHAALGGAGTAAAYEAAYGTGTSDTKNTTRDGLFPTAKVVAGYDFVGESWAGSGPLAPDDDPIDFEGHGTHVADIIAGAKGVAPGASLVAVKACSAVSSSCSGVALLQAVDFSLDPNGDGDMADAVDVINMSLGSSYGQIEDDLTLASSNAVAFGTIVVASAGNSADRPFIAGSPSIAPGVISVAQTQVPSASAIPLIVNSPAAIAGVYGNTATVDWAPIGAGVTGNVTTATAAGAADNLACAPLAPNSLSGRIALIDRGACAISIKVDNAAKAGATGFLLALNAPGDAVTFSFGGGTTFVPTLVIQQSLGNSIKSRLTAGDTVNVSISPAGAIALVGSMVGSSSRGPSFSLKTIKPEIGAPGASISAVAGSGTGTQAFGGTSGAAPMVAGAAALLAQAYPQRSPLQIKAMLMNSAETNVYTNPATQPGALAPITRIGAGEVRVNRAVGRDVVAWDTSALSAALSYGVVEADGEYVVHRWLTLENFGTTRKQYRVATSFRYDNDRASGAVKVQAANTVVVQPGRTARLKVSLIVDGAKLPEWTMNGGSNGGNGGRLNDVEFDGYVTLTSGSEKITVPWHVLPRKAANTAVTAVGTSSLTLANGSVNAGAFDVFSLTGTSGQFPASVLPGPGDNFAVIDLKSVGVRFLPDSMTGAGDLLQFAISTHGRRAHPNYPAEFDIYIDTNGDGSPDFVVYNSELTGFAATGQNVVTLLNLNTGAGGIFFFADSDLVSGNMIMTVPMAQLGIAPGTTIRFDAYAFDNYFTGALTDVIGGMAFTPGGAAFSGPVSGTLAAGSSASVPFVKASVPAANSSELGLLMMYRRNAGAESQEVLLPR